jgi:dTDP-glucose 4,6-dehydratase
MRNILVTGGAGFIGSNFINYVLNTYNDVFIVNLDKLTYAGNLENLIGIDEHRHYAFVRGDITNGDLVKHILKKFEINYVINFAAESHVDRSIANPSAFYETNVLGTNILLNAAREAEVDKFIQISTDEVYGSIDDGGLFTESSPLRPMNPYSSSKAGADLMALSFYNTYKMPVVITRCSNNYGPFQYPEKLIPRMSINACRNKPLPVFGDGSDIRDWIYVHDHNSAIMAALEYGRPGEVYNIGANNEKTNLDIVKLILDYLDKPYSLIKFCDDRPGHDTRYAIDSTKIRTELNWEPEYTFNDAIIRTIDWYANNQSWWEKLENGEHKNKIYYNELRYQDISK